MKIPFIDFQAHLQGIRTEIDGAIRQVLDSGQFIRSGQVAKFERAFERKWTIPQCIGMANGTDALYAILKTLGIGPGDEVITPAWSWISSAQVITQTGAKPVFCDVEQEYYTIDPARVAEKITPATRAIIVVHLYGQMADIPALLRLCERNNIHLIEDCAQSHLTSGFGRMAGGFGAASAFSFYPTKNLGAFGDAGCAATHDEELALRLRRFANHGGLTKDEHLTEGFNSRLDELQAAILTVKLKYLELWNQKRIQNAALYSQRLADKGGIHLPRVRPETSHTFHLFVIRTDNRDALKEHLLSNEIETAIHYPSALPFEPAFSYLHCRLADFPVAARLQKEVLSLPVYPELTPEKIEYVCERINQFES